MATPIQAKVSVGLQNVRFEARESAPGRDVRLVVTSETLEYLQSLMDDKREVMIDGEGSVTVSSLDNPALQHGDRTIMFEGPHEAALRFKCGATRSITRAIVEFESQARG